MREICTKNSLTKIKTQYHHGIEKSVHNFENETKNCGATQHDQ